MTAMMMMMKRWKTSKGPEVATTTAGEEAVVLDLMPQGGTSEKKAKALGRVVLMARERR
jgi:hypothetical protein